MQTAQRKTDDPRAGAFVEIIERTPKGGERRVVRCTLGQDGVVRCVGEPRIAEQLNSHGVTFLDPVSGAAPRTFTCEDGERFLKALSMAYRTAYLYATNIQGG
ncbi:MAG: hypothetical protein UX17_C0047G0001 [Parcubacteria group bacterium GW2011_GWC2_45_7]|nr:MAG: hypothetical protein UX17_C0047G0001 [Parcubacteria group bacterium GW2011_GWC2_45_7]KKU73927.1 MAG: hypothetical protein UX98_C0003G0002 [Parcubacteria group bacterium GW2011_GWA2_47_26]